MNGRQSSPLAISVFLVYITKTSRPGLETKPYNPLLCPAINGPRTCYDAQFTCCFQKLLQNMNMKNGETFMTFNP